ncbi:MAG: sulfurtransferase [Caldilinea sp. CFX5]|nr:sulfurtransferase [Caldilinea sp. CFX5]
MVVTFWRCSCHEDDRPRKEPLLREPIAFSPLVTTHWLAERLADPQLCLFDVRSAEAYAASHLPGARHIDLTHLNYDRPGAPAMLVPLPAFQEQMRQWDLTPQSQVVVYDDHWGLAASRLLWSLVRFGFRQAALLNGGWDQWQEENRPVNSALPEPRASTFVPIPDDTVVADLAWVQAHGAQPDVLLLDTRSPKEYSAGHIPGARSWDWFMAAPATGWEAMQPAAQLQPMLLAAGITPEKEVVTYCAAGVRAAHTFWVLRTLGYPRVRNYDGSWLEWSQQPGLPIEQGNGA